MCICSNRHHEHGFYFKLLAAMALRTSQLSMGDSARCSWSDSGTASGTSNVTLLELPAHVIDQTSPSSASRDEKQCLLKQQRGPSSSSHGQSQHEQISEVSSFITHLGGRSGSRWAM